MLLSIILPFYRVAPYINACLDSILPLPPEEVELIFVDDRGEDESRSIIEGRILRRSNAHLLRHEKNRGLSAARNTGLAHAAGEYILFLDSDDLLITDAVLSLLIQARAERLDILQGAYETFADDGSAPPSAINGEATGVLSGEACLAGLLGAGRFEPMVWQRMYRRAFLLANGLTMREGLLHEDELFTAPAFLKAERAQVIGTPFYRYRCRDSGIMGSFARSSKWCGDYLAIAGELLALSHTPPPGEAKALLRERAASIALSIGKNITAYGLEGQVLREAMAFLMAHKAEIADITAQSSSASLRWQGRLLKYNPQLFLRMYARFS